MDARLPARLQAKIELGPVPPDPYLKPWTLGPCWIWTGGRTSGGHGPHVDVYELLVGPVPRGLDLDHLCRVPPCVNPAHVKPVTRRENLLRGDTLTARHAAKTRCPAGHLYDEANTRIDKRGSRICRACDRDRQRKKRR